MSNFDNDMSDFLTEYSDQSITPDFESSGEAYDRIQWDDHIRTGRIFTVESEKIVGIAWAWPIAVTLPPLSGPALTPKHREAQSSYRLGLNSSAFSRNRLLLLSVRVLMTCAQKQRAAKEKQHGKQNLSNLYWRFRSGWT